MARSVRAPALKTTGVIMKLAPLFALVALTAAGVAGTAAAGNPQSTGLTHTQAVARQARATLVVVHNDAACLQTAARSVSAMPGLQTVTVRDGAMQATFANPLRAAEARGDVDAAVSAACQRAG